MTTTDSFSRFRRIASHTAGRLRWRRSKISYRCSLLRSDRLTVWFPTAVVSMVLMV